MTTKGRIRLRRIQKMLKACAEGHEIREGQHKLIVRWNGLTFPDLPQGSHGSKNPEIERGVIKRMVRTLGLDLACVRRHLPQLGI